MFVGMGYRSLLIRIYRLAASAVSQSAGERYHVGIKGGMATQQPPSHPPSPSYIVVVVK